jgi:hypothetical protein
MTRGDMADMAGSHTCAPTQQLTILRPEAVEPVMALPSEDLDPLMSWSSRAELFHRCPKEQVLLPSENLELITSASPPPVAARLYDASVIPVGGGTVQPELPDILPFHIDTEAEGSDNDSDTKDAAEDEDDTEDATEDLESNMATVDQLYNLNMWLQRRANEQPEEEDDEITAVPGPASFVPVSFDDYLFMGRMRHNGSRRTTTLKLQSDYHEP